MTRQLDTEPVRQMIIAAIGRHDCLADAAIAGVNVIRVRDEATLICLPYGLRLAEKMMQSMPVDSRVSRKDLEQAAAMGVCEGVNTYEPAKTGPNGAPLSMTTHLFNKVRTRMQEERNSTHWYLTQPPRPEIRKFMGGKMTESEAEHYAASYLQVFELE